MRGVTNNQVGYNVMINLPVSSSSLKLPQKNENLILHILHYFVSTVHHIFLEKNAMAGLFQYALSFTSFFYCCIFNFVDLKSSGHISKFMLLLNSL